MFDYGVFRYNKLAEKNNYIFINHVNFHKFNFNMVWKLFLALYYENP